MNILNRFTFLLIQSICNHCMCSLTEIFGKRFVNVSLEKGSLLYLLFLGKKHRAHNCFCRCFPHHSQHPTLCPWARTEHLLLVEHCPSPGGSLRHRGHPCPQDPTYEWNKEPEKKQVITSEWWVVGSLPGEGTWDWGHRGRDSVRATGDQAELAKWRRTCRQGAQHVQRCGNTARCRGVSGGKAGGWVS